MNRFFVKILSHLVLVTALWTLPANRLFADACGCAKNEVEIWYEHALLPTYEIIEVELDGIEVKPGNNPFGFEIDKVRHLTLDPVENIDFQALGLTGSAIEMTLYFPHCSIEYSEDNGKNWFRASNLKLLKDFWQIQTVLLRITAGPKDDARDSASSGGSGSSGGFGSSVGSGSGSSGGFGSSGGSVAPGLPANVSTSPASFHRVEGLYTVPVPAGFGLEIPMGDAPTLMGYRSAGHLVSYGPLDGTAASPGKLKLNMIGEVAGLTSEQDGVDAATGNTERHYLAPFGVFRVRGWNSQSQEPASLVGASATLVEVYERHNYFTESKTFQGLPHSYYRLEALPSGIQLVQSNFGIVSTRSWQMTGQYSITETDGFQTTVTQTVGVTAAINTMDSMRWCDFVNMGVKAMKT